jgi:hypothetical protein
VKKHINLFTVIMFVIVVASLAGSFRGIPGPSKIFGFSNGG